MLAAMPDLNSGLLAALTAVAAVLGYLASRSIVAESDAHRRDQPDRWGNPVCTVCGEPLRPSLLRCSWANHPQSLRNGVVVVVTIALFCVITLVSSHIALVPAYLLFGAAMVLLTLTDLDTLLLPNRILWPATWMGGLLLLVGALVAGEWSSFLRGGAAAVVYFAVMFVLALIAAGALGFGDVKLAFVIGLFAGFLGWGHLAVASIGAFILGGVIAVLLLLFRRASRKDAIPFGPFMTSAALIAVVFGDAIVDWYVG